MDNISCNSFTAILYFVCMAAKCSTSTDTHHIMFSVVFTIHHTHQISCHFCLGTGVLRLCAGLVRCHWPY